MVGSGYGLRQEVERNPERPCCRTLLRSVLLAVASRKRHPPTGRVRHQGCSVIKLSVFPTLRTRGQKAPGVLTFEDQQRFLARINRVAPSDCWEWSGTLTSDGYGAITIKGVIYRAHRLTWMITHGKTLKRHEFVCHSCDNPPCCNPSHLWVGSSSDNLKDAMSKGRWPGKLKRLYSEQLSPPSADVVEDCVEFEFELTPIV